MSKENASNGAPLSVDREPGRDPRPDEIRRQLDKILKSRRFNRSQRCTGFLRYVVEQALADPAGLPKERTIGIEAFQRKPTYDSDVDPVVRISAAEVRRRLQGYYATDARPGELRIELPRGQYRPEFTPGEPTAAPAALADPGPAEVAAADAAPSQALSRPRFDPPPRAVTFRAVPAPGRARWRWALGPLAALGLLVGLLLPRPGPLRRARASTPTLLDSFWAPALSAPAGIAISVGDMSDLKQMSGMVFPASSEFGPLSSQIQWTDVNWEDARAAATISTVLGPQLRFFRRSSNTSPAAVNAVPTVFVGAFDNAWTLRLTAGLPFHFRGGFGNPCCSIAEARAPGQVFVADKNHDYAIVARLNENPGSARRYIAAGIGPGGTVAAGELISNPTDFEQIARFAPAHWGNMNVELLVRTDITGGQPGPPIVQAARFW